MKAKTEIKWVEVKFEYREGEYNPETEPKFETQICGLLGRESTEEENEEDIWYFKDENELEYHKPFRGFGEKGGYTHFKVIEYSYINL